MGERTMDAAYLDDLIGGYQRTQIFAPALEVRVFEMLEKPCSAAMVAEKVGWSAKGTRMLLDTEAGDTYPQEEVAEWTRQAGFPPGRLVDITPQTRPWLTTKQ